MNVSAQLTVQIPDSIVAIGPDAFSDLGYTPNIQFGDDTKIEYISQRAFLGTNVTDVMSIIPDTIKGQSSFEVTEYGNTFVYPYEIYSTEEEPSTLYLAGYQEVNKNVYYVSFDCTDGYCGYHKREYGTTKEYEPINAVPMLSNIFEEGKVESMNYQAKSGVVIKNIMNENPIYAEILRKDLLRTYNTRAVSEAKIGNFEYMFSPAYQMHGTPRAVEKTKPKRLYYTPAEAAQHVNHTNNNKITFTFK